VLQSNPPKNKFAQVESCLERKNCCNTKIAQAKEGKKERKKEWIFGKQKKCASELN
jgi:hypothetical protein